MPRQRSVQRGRGLVTRMRFVPFAGEALGFGDLRGRHLARNIVAKLHCLLPVFTGVSRRGEVVPQMGLHVIL